MEGFDGKLNQFRGKEFNSPRENENYLVGFVQVYIYFLGGGDLNFSLHSYIVI